MSFCVFREREEVWVGEILAWGSVGLGKGVGVDGGWGMVGINWMADSGQ